MLSTVDQANALVVLPAPRRRRPRTTAAAGTVTTGLGTRTATTAGPPGGAPAGRTGRGPSATPLRAAPSRSRTPLGTDRVDVLRIVSDPRTPTYVTVYANGRRRYSYWRPLDSTTGMGGCYAALPTDECDELHAAGRIVLGEPVVDPNRTTYRVRPATRAQQPPVPMRVVRERRRAA